MLKPVGHRVLVKADEVKSVSEGGIIMVLDDRMEKAGQQYGTLVAAGEQAWKAFSANFDGLPWAKPGDKVVYAKHAGRFIKDPYTDEEFVVLNDEDIVVITTPGKNPEF